MSSKKKSSGRADSKEPTSAKGAEASELAELWAGTSMELLKSLHILTRDGRMNQDSRRKLKQVRHLVQLIAPHLEGCESIADLGAGKSYLGFILYDLWLREREGTRLFAIESRKELVDACKLIASRSGFNRISFVARSILEASEDAASVPEQIDAVTALHACDTATDEAIAFALKKNAKVIALVPCCQAEVARLLEAEGSRSTRDLEILWRHGLHRREFGSHLTNVIRSLVLESRGYKVRVTELIGWEHSMKNELILAERVQKSNGLARKQLASILETFPIPMKLFELLPADTTPS